MLEEKTSKSNNPNGTNEVKKENEEVLQKSQKKLKRHNKALEALKKLNEKFPNAFDLENIRPLKIGVYSDLTQSIINGELSLTRGEIWRALHIYTNKVKYLLALKQGGFRYDLNGQEVEKISEEDKKSANERLKAFKNKQKKKRLMKKNKAKKEEKQ